MVWVNQFVFSFSFAFIWNKKNIMSTLLYHIKVNPIKLLNAVYPLFVVYCIPSIHGVSFSCKIDLQFEALESGLLGRCILLFVANKTFVNITELIKHWVRTVLKLLCNACILHPFVFYFSLGKKIHDHFMPKKKIILLYVEKICEFAYKKCIPFLVTLFAPLRFFFLEVKKNRPPHSELEKLKKKKKKIEYTLFSNKRKQNAEWMFI